MVSMQAGLPAELLSLQPKLSAPEMSWLQAGLACVNCGDPRVKFVCSCCRTQTFCSEQCQEACTRSYAKAVGRSTVVDQSELVMDEEEAEKAAAPTTADKSGTDQGADKKVRVSWLQTPAMTVSSVGEHQETATTNAVGVGPVLQDEGPTGESSDATSVSETQQAASIKPAVDESALGNMDAETTPAKRRHDDVSAVSQEQRLRQVEASLEANGVTKKPRSAVRMHASSLTRGGKEVNSFRRHYGDCTKRRDGK
ncbi:hypothetical protein HPB49_009643 [Dermacentor silvarum]|uniref:Uncharacterized protein n=1 Tax=Dermacentor silvarum TaxID=543639 RepID=A0ACB8D4F4_DERSI|nr:hypothetical protein HPB49_009643 [Dermacentor silvarum]